MKKESVKNQCPRRFACPSVSCPPPRLASRDAGAGEAKRGASQNRSSGGYKANEYRISRFKILMLLWTSLCLGLCGCAEMSGYSNESLLPEDVSSVYVEMFDNQSLRRGVEYELTDALAKRIEVETPYKIISSRDRADTVISGQIVRISESVLTRERETGLALEKEAELHAVVNWKNLKTGELLIDNQLVSAAASYSEYQNQDFRYASALAANNLARKIVELMEKEW